MVNKLLLTSIFSISGHTISRSSVHKFSAKMATSMTEKYFLDEAKTKAGGRWFRTFSAVTVRYSSSLNRAASPDISPGFRNQVRLQWFWVRAWTDRDTETLSVEGRRVPRAAAGVHEPK